MSQKTLDSMTADQLDTYANDIDLRLRNMQREYSRENEVSETIQLVVIKELSRSWAAAIARFYMLEAIEESTESKR